MVLAYWGDEFSEAEIAKRLGTKNFGTPISNIKRLQGLGYQVSLGSLTPDDLKIHLIAGRPVLARVWTVILDYWDTTTSHVVVVRGFDDMHVYVNDPAFAQSPQTVLWDGFLAAWGEFDEIAMVIYPLK
jgi:ABC-type bacteriocin/lantibiotic exporter with double-glycine peptidase domain